MRSRKLICALLTAAFIAGSFGFSSGSKGTFLDPAPATVNAASFNEQGVTEFVTRLYDICLDRTPDTAGLNDWVGKLASGDITGVEAAYGFIFSDEFQSKLLSNSDYVEKMYRAFLGRDSDPAGKSSWVDLMDNGMSRADLFYGFANSDEFTGICESYGIERGDYTSDGRFVNTTKIRGFVTRLYEICLGREPDTDGLNGWCEKLSSGRISGKEAAYGFFFSVEFRQKARMMNYEDIDGLIDIYYMVFLNRHAEDAGKAYWLSKLNGTGNYAAPLFEGFADSTEFASVCSSYGIDAGPHIDLASMSDFAGVSARVGNNYSTLSTFDTFWADNDYGWDMELALDHYSGFVFASEFDDPEEITPHSDLERYCMQLLGVPYVFGGSSLSGFDCSGVVKYVYENYYGISLPHNAEAMSHLGRDVGTTGSLWQPGDIICCDTDHNGSIDHAMMYLGDYYLDTGYWGSKVTMKRGCPTDIIVTVRHIDH